MHEAIDRPASEHLRGLTDRLAPADKIELIDRLASQHSLELSEYQKLVSGYTPELAKYAASVADRARRDIYGTDIFVRGLIEIGNVCRNDCYYCGIRRSNTECDRYVLSPEEILECTDEGYALGFRTFVLQSGEGTLDADTICGLVSEIKDRHPDCALTLSLGEYPADVYRRFREAGADRYLLRHETADRTHYGRLHPGEMSFANRMRCLYDLKDLGFQVGCGFMVGSPYQSAETLAEDLKFIEEFSPDMCGIGPFIPHKSTPFAAFPSGDADLTCFLLSLIRLIKPEILLPATTALGTIDPKGREKGILAGANVVMPNLSPVSVRRKYDLYDNKICTGEESAQCRGCLEERMGAIGFRVVTDRGDIRTC